MYCSKHSCLPDGSPLDYYASLRRLHAAIGGAGITRERGKHGFRILRHSAGTLLYEMSRDLKLVQGTLRQADISTTSDIYVHLNDAVLQEGTDLLTEEQLGNRSQLFPRKAKWWAKLFSTGPYPKPEINSEVRPGLTRFLPLHPISLCTLTRSGGRVAPLNQ